MFHRWKIKPSRAEEELAKARSQLSDTIAQKIEIEEMGNSLERLRKPNHLGARLAASNTARRRRRA